MSEYFIEAPVNATDEDGRLVSRGWYAVPRAVFDQYWLYRRSARNNERALLLACGGDEKKMRKLITEVGMQG